MIVKVRRFSNVSQFRRYVRYCISPKQAARFTPERLVHYESQSVLLPTAFDPGDPEACRATARRITDQFEDWVRATRPGRPTPKYPFVIPIVTFHPDDHRVLSPRLQAKVIRELIERVMPGERQVFLPIHGDADHGHGHPCVGAVDANGKIWNPRHDFRIWEQGCEELEVKYGLTRVRQRKACAKADPTREVVRSSPKPGEIQSAVRAHVAPPRLRLQEQIAGLLDDSPEFAVFAERLAAQRIRVVPNLASTGRVSGLTFFDDTGVPHKGSSLGKGFTFGAIAKITRYDQERHHQIIGEWSNRPTNRPAHPGDRSPAPRADADQTGSVRASCATFEILGTSRGDEPGLCSRECRADPGPEHGRAADAATDGGMGAPSHAVGRSQGSPQASRFQAIARQWADLAEASVARLCEALVAVAQFVASRIAGAAGRRAAHAHKQMRHPVIDCEPDFP